MPETAESKPFQVDLRGVVDLLSRHIYSGPRVFLRELLQNGNDAITARAQHDGRHDQSWGIRIVPASADQPMLRFIDDGIGLTAAEVGDLLATVGRSSKRDIFDLPRGDFLGQFGIGLLSCFMVADRIVIRSRSAKGGAPVEWIGSAEGTFTVRELPESEASDLRIGTEVQLQPRADESLLLSADGVIELATHYGEFLPVPVRIDRDRGDAAPINSEPLFLLDAEAKRNPSTRSALLAYGRELIGVEPFDAIDLSLPGGGTAGTAFVLPYSPPPGSKQASRVYLGRMLLNPRIDELLPDWAFFVRCVINTSALHPTASREQLIEDESLEFTREQLGGVLRRWVLQLGVTNPSKLAEFVSIHHLALRSLVIHDDELAGFITKWLTIETSNGHMTIDELLSKHRDIRYAETVDEFRQLASIVPRERPIVNGGYIYDADILRRLPHLFDGVTVDRVSVSGELDNLDLPPLEERNSAIAFEDRATAALTEANCTVVVRSFLPDDLASLYLADPEVLRSIERGTARKVSGALWGGVLDRIDSQVAKKAEESGSEVSQALLCLNWASPLIRTLCAVDDDAVFARSIQLLYTQALLAGHRPLGAADRAMLTTAMADLVHLSITQHSSDPI